jgi:hypothetical protein
MGRIPLIIVSNNLINNGIIKYIIKLKTIENQNILNWFIIFNFNRLASIFLLSKIIFDTNLIK